MLKPGGYASITDQIGGKVVRENDTFTCAHKNEIIHVPPGLDKLQAGHMCRACMRLICDDCADEMNRTLKCVPMEERLLQMESRADRRRRGGRFSE